jgi:hypothetical protein
VKIVGDDLHPLGQVKDFAPFVAKIKAAGADSIVTGNWGQDLTLLIKAAKDAGLNADFYTYYAGVSGTPTALARAWDIKVRQSRASATTRTARRDGQAGRPTSRPSSTTTGTPSPDLQRHRDAGHGMAGQEHRSGQGGGRR